MRRVLSAAVLVLVASAAHAAHTVTPWVPIFQGIEQASGTNNVAAPVSLAVNALRIDLHDPDIRLTLTPPLTNSYVPDVRETLLQTPSEFLAEHGLQVAINAVYFSPPGYNNPSGTPAWLTGVAISEGRVVSVQTQATLSDSQSAMLFTTNNQASFFYLNSPPAGTEGIFTGFSGLYPLLSNGVNISFAYTNSADTLHFRQPRTAFGLSADKRYLILVTIDGRQNDFSDGALDWETADFLLLFGAWDGMNMDGGGSTCMVKSSYCGDPIEINQNYFQFAVGRPGAQRPIGCSLGVRARPLAGPIRDLAFETGPTTALLTWKTETPASTQVEYGLTQNYGSSTPLDSRLTKMHVANLYGLLTGSNYYFRCISDTGSEAYSLACRLRPVSAASSGTLAFDVTNSWKYTTNNLLDGTNWKTPGYDDSGWSGPGPGLLYVESNPLVAPRNTLLPPGNVSSGTPIPRTYYFRTRFVFGGDTAGLSLIFSNYVDDGAVFYLNGGEIFRLRVPPLPTLITNLTPATGGPCAGTAQAGDAATICPDVFTITGNLLTNLVQGTNVLAVEVHNAGAVSATDLVFGSALIFSRQGTVLPKLNIFSEDNLATLYWNGEGFALQQSADMPSTNSWTNVTGPVSTSPVTVTNAVAAFYRLRRP